MVATFSIRAFLIVQHFSVVHFQLPRIAIDQLSKRVDYTRFRREIALSQKVVTVTCHVIAPTQLDAAINYRVNLFRWASGITMTWTDHTHRDRDRETYRERERDRESDACLNE